MQRIRLAQWCLNWIRQSSPLKARTKHRMHAAIESCESRCLLAVTLSFDYSFDTNNFFADTARRTLLEAAGTTLSQRLNDSLSAITPGGTDSWNTVVSHPGTGGELRFTNQTIPANTIIVYAGGRELGGTLGVGGFGGFGGSGSTAFINSLTRGQAGARLAPASQTDFGPWGGAITFDITTNWFFGATTAGMTGSQSDFVSVATHELAHLLGFGTASSFSRLVSGGTFVGIASQAQYDVGGAVPLFGDNSHWANGTTDGGFETAMDPSLTNGTRKGFSELDFAALDDLGWDLGAPPTSFQRTITLTDGAAHTLVIEDVGTAADGMMRMVLDGVATSFANPSSSLIINGGNLDDIIQVTSLDNGFAATITINGQAGNDTLQVTTANNGVVGPVTLNGLAGNDTLQLNSDLGTTAKSIDGGLGIDSLRLTGTAATSVVTTYLTAASSSFTITNALATETVNVLDVETLTDELVVTARSVAMLATADTLTLGDDGSQAGLSRLSGASASFVYDFINPTGSLTLNGGFGNDVLTVGPLDSLLTAPITLNGEGGNDALSGALVSVGLTLNGGIASDTLTGGSGNDVLNGDADTDTLTGGAGSDIINGGTSANTLIETADLSMELTPTTLTMRSGAVVVSTDTISGISGVLFTGGPSANVLDLTTFVPSSGVLCTIVGGGGHVTIVGTNNIDFITANSTVGVSVIGGSGNDVITTGSGNDRVDGGGGNDSILGGAGNDLLVGSGGDDTINGGSGSDTINGLTGNDSILCGTDNDTVNAGTGNDTVFGELGDDKIFGGTDNDVLNGGDGRDSLFGDAGNDIVNGDVGNDLVRGSLGIDTLDGGAGTDRQSEEGDTNMTVVGMTYSSPLLATTPEAPINVERFDLSGGANPNVLDARLASGFVILNGLGGNDTILGSAFNDTLFGGDGNDVITGGAGIDVISGGIGNDAISGGAGIDVIDGGEGTKDVSFETVDDAVVIVTGVVITASITTGETTIGMERVAVIGGSGNNLIDATAANAPVSLLGGDGNDTLLGAGGQDFLHGGSRLSPLGGIDSLDGGGALDTYDNDPQDTRVLAGVGVNADVAVASFFALSTVVSWLDTV